MWSRLTGSLTFLIQVLIVVGGVLLFSFFDPFNLFGSRKKTLHGTPVELSSIREMGQLITAEYYGEVLSSLKEAQMEEINANIEELKRLDEDLERAIDTMRKEAPKMKGLFRKRHIEDYFKDNYPHVVNHPYYPYLMDFLIDSLKPNRERTLIAFLFDNGYKKMPKTKMDFSNVFNKRGEEIFVGNKKELKKQIVLVGRGCVRAGYDFGSFNEHNFKYLPSSNQVFFIGLEAKILEYYINPWFIPERRVKGFEIIAFNGKADNIESLTSAKKECLTKLLNSAKNKNILEKAEENARQTLEQFFSLLLENEGKKVKVVFVKSLFSFYRNTLLSDGAVKGEEVQFLDTLFTDLVQQNQERKNNEDILALNLDTLEAFMKLVRSTPYYPMEEVRDSVNFYSAFARKVVQDQCLDSTEVAALSRKKENLDKPFALIDTLWYQYRDAGNNERGKQLRKKDFESTIAFIRKHTVYLALAKDTVRKDPVKINKVLDNLQ